MKNINGTRVALLENGYIYVQGNFLDWYNDDKRCLNDRSPVQLKKCTIQEIVADGIYVSIDDSASFSIIENGEEILNDEVLSKYQVENSIEKVIEFLDEDIDVKLFNYSLRAISLLMTELEKRDIYVAYNRYKDCIQKI